MLRCDFKASAALPLKNKSEVFGCLTFYAGEADAFSPEEIDLLKELARQSRLWNLRAACQRKTDFHPGDR